MHRKRINRFAMSAFKLWIRTDRKRLACRCEFCSDKLFHGSNNFILLGMSELREHRQGNDFSGHTLRDWEVSVFETEVLIGLLLMKRNRIVDAGPNSGFPQTRLQRFPILHPDHVEVVNAPGPGGFHGNYDGILEARKQLVSKIVDRALVYDDEIVAIVLHGNFAVVLGENKTAPAIVAEAVSEVLTNQGIDTSLDSSKCGSDGVRTRAGLILFLACSEAFNRNVVGIISQRIA